MHACMFTCRYYVFMCVCCVCAIKSSLCIDILRNHTKPTYLTYDVALCCNNNRVILSQVVRFSKIVYESISYFQLEFSESYL